MKKRFWISVIIGVLLVLSFAVPTLATVLQTSPEVGQQLSEPATVCSKCGADITGEGTQSELAKALGMDICMDCWMDILYGSYRADSMLMIARLGEDGKVLPEQLPEGQGGSPYWGDILGTLSNQTDLQSVLDSKLSAITGTQLDNIFSQNGLLKRSGIGTYTIDTNTYLIGNQSITLSGDASGNGATSITVTNTGLKGKAIPTLVTGYLYYNGSAWVFQTPAGGGGATVKSGTITTNSSGEATVTFNTPFSDTNYAISLVAVTTADTVTCMANSKTVNGFSIETEDDGGKSEPNIVVNWIATPYSNP